MRGAPLPKWNSDPSVQEIYLLQKLFRASLIAHCCSSHQNRKMCLLLIWWQAPYVPYEKGVNKMHVGNIKQGQGRQFGWWPFFKCGKQKNKMALAVAAVGRSGFGWGAWGLAAEVLLPVPCVCKNHCSLPNTETLYGGCPKLCKASVGKKKRKIPILLPKGSLGGGREEGGVSVESGWEGRAHRRLQALEPPQLRVLLRASGDEWCYCVPCESHPDWTQVGGRFLKIST